MCRSTTHGRLTPAGVCDGPGDVQAKKAPRREGPTRGRTARLGWGARISAPSSRNLVGASLFRTNSKFFSEKFLRRFAARCIVRRGMVFICQIWEILPAVAPWFRGATGRLDPAIRECRAVLSRPIRPRSAVRPASATQQKQTTSGSIAASGRWRFPLPGRPEGCPQLSSYPFPASRKSSTLSRHRS